MRETPSKCQKVSFKPAPTHKSLSFSFLPNEIIYFPWHTDLFLVRSIIRALSPFTFTIFSCSLNLVLSVDISPKITLQRLRLTKCAKLPSNKSLPLKILSSKSHLIDDATNDTPRTSMFHEPRNFLPKIPIPSIHPPQQNPPDSSTFTWNTHSSATNR